jgi:hypothetical protein
VIYSLGRRRIDRYGVSPPSTILEIEMTTNQYADRDAEALQQDGGHYARHVDAMTVEGLHGKSNIAAELAWRDSQIQQLKEELAKPKQVPLTEEQVFCLIEANTKWMPAGGFWRLNEVKFARAIEAAQNITGDKSC